MYVQTETQNREKQTRQIIQNQNALTQPNSSSSSNYYHYS